jgi:hypothetical protein
MFNGGETKLQAVALNNVHEEVGKFQERGMAMMIHGDLIQQFDLEGSGCDNLGLGHLTFMRFVSDDKIATRVFCGYSLCANKKRNWAQCTSNTADI